MDPILTPLFIGAGITGGITIGGQTILYAQILSTIVSTALVVGVSALLAPKPEDGHSPLQQPIPPRIWVVGEARVAGAYMLFEEYAGKLYVVTALAGHRIAAIVGVYLNDDLVEIVAGIVQPGTDGRYGPNTGFFGAEGPNIVSIDTRLGLPTETAYADIVAALTAEGIWTSSHRGDGQASLGMIVLSPKADQLKKLLPYGAPKPSAIVQGALVWDCRDELQDPADPDTWEYSTNSVLLMLWHQCFNEFGHLRDYIKAVLPVLEMWQDEADVCDEAIAKNGGGTEARYSCNGWASAENDPKVSTNSILATCDGWICERGDGALLITVGKFREELVGTITDDDLAGYYLQRGIYKDERVNKLAPTFTYPDTDYATTETDAFVDEDAILLDGRPLSAQADFGWCHSWRTARRLGKREWLRTLQKRRGSLDVRLSGINAVYNRWNRVESTAMIPALNDCIVENRSSRISLMTGGFQMEFIEHPEDIDDWTPATDEGDAPPVPERPGSVAVPVPDNLVPGVETRSVAGGSVLVLTLTVDEPTRDDLTLEVDYSLAGDDEWIRTAVADGTLTGTSGPIDEDEDYDFRARFRGPAGTPGVYATEFGFNVAAVTNPAAPAALTGVAVSTGVGNTGKAVVGYTVPLINAPAKVAIYAAPAGTPIDRNNPSHVWEILNVSPNTGYSRTVGDASRVNLLLTPDFASDTNWTKGTGWTISAGKGHKAAGTASGLVQAISAMSVGQVARLGVTTSSVIAGTLNMRVTGVATIEGSATQSGNGVLLDSITATAAHTFAGMRGSATFDGKVDDAIYFIQSVTCLPQGLLDFEIVPMSGTNVAGPADTAANVLIY